MVNTKNPKEENNINKERSFLLYISTTNPYKRLDSYFILDSGATEHWTPHKE